MDSQPAAGAVVITGPAGSAPSLLASLAVAEIAAQDGPQLLPASPEPDVVGASKQLAYGPQLLPASPEPDVQGASKPLASDSVARPPGKVAAMRGRSASTPATASRCSARIGAAMPSGSSTPTISERAAIRAAAQDLGPGTSSPPPSSDCSFSALAGVPLGHLAKVARDSAIIFRGELGPPLEQIETILAKEILDGKLAAAKARISRALETASVSSPNPVGAEHGPQAGPIVCGRTRSRTIALHRAHSASLVPGNRTPTIVPLRALFWNIRGFGREGRRRQLIKYMRDEHIDIVAIQETMRADFSLPELQGLSSHLFAWHWLPSSGIAGHSGGILLGVKDDTFEIGSMDRGEYFVSMELFERAINFKWEFIVVYGPADHSRSSAFLEELLRKISNSTLPVAVGGDFNLIRQPSDKNNSRVNFPRMQQFNDCLADLGLHELDRIGARFTWTNNQSNPTLCVLDQVFMSPEWELRRPLASLRAITRIGSD